MFWPWGWKVRAPSGSVTVPGASLDDAAPGTTRRERGSKAGGSHPFIRPEGLRARAGLAASAHTAPPRRRSDAAPSWGPAGGPEATARLPAWGSPRTSWGAPHPTAALDLHSVSAAIDKRPMRLDRRQVAMPEPLAKTCQEAHSPRHERPEGRFGVSAAGVCWWGLLVLVGEQTRALHPKRGKDGTPQGVCATGRTSHMPALPPHPPQVPGPVRLRGIPAPGQPPMPASALLPGWQGHGVRQKPETWVPSRPGDTLRPLALPNETGTLPPASQSWMAPAARPLGNMTSDRRRGKACRPSPRRSGSLWSHPP
ncbi:mucin-1-like [Canis lupus familiaris]|uniref:mucin-1-like n=1 Tax=Canis lupus familiaris TaxID=9615 RepID=UPI0015F1A128|nr:mucin-1-like [Canis lupus familiaris]XP_038525681.1 mucin-1-like [Canis lupus familiaris]